MGFLNKPALLLLCLCAGLTGRTQIKDSFVLVPKGQYTVGKRHFLLNPLRAVRVDSFYIAIYETTNRQFAEFVTATGYRTDAERRHDALVFAPGLAEFRWLSDTTAYWRYPNGVTRGGIDKKMDHPVTCISYSDITAYCRWAGVRLPTLEEWEIACRAGTTTDYFFGDNDSVINRYANIWHGHDHLTADSSDGYMYTSPVGSFAPNPWGLYDMYGNVFEFCTGKLDPAEKSTLAHTRGGSWWCSAASCHYFTSYDIGRVNIHASFSNQGFRVVRPAPAKREALQDLPDLSSFALVVSGIRRCGKSTLLFQLLKEKYPDALYLNFEDIRLYEFEKNDFTRLDKVIKSAGSRVLLFDEIQIVSGWERYVQQKLDEEYKVVITGSNASLLSRELGTKLTDRQVTKELFPFSYSEFCQFRQLTPDVGSLTQYLEIGGFPEFVKQEHNEILNHVFDDILTRDIAVRHGLREVKTLQRLALYLVSNVGNLVTANRLKTLFEVGSANTITEYLSYLEDSYLFELVPKFSYSLRKQLVNPRKVYSIDTGMITINSGSFTDDAGRKLENLVYLHLRRRYREIYYFSDRKECDFVVFKNGAPVEAIQVCFDLNADNLDRELDGLLAALKELKLKEGKIVTLNQKDQYEKDGLKMLIIPCHEFLLS
jgi:predicted AAA+ superfamily ATPase/formylglycine-generating enzyme required for sulfatase activity